MDHAPNPGKFHALLHKIVLQGGTLTSLFKDAPLRSSESLLGGETQQHTLEIRNDGNIEFIWIAQK